MDRDSDGGPDDDPPGPPSREKGEKIDPDGDDGWDSPDGDDGNGGADLERDDHDDSNDDLFRNVGIVTLVSIGLGLAAFLVGTAVILVVASVLLVSGIPVFDMPAVLIALSFIGLQGIGFGGVSLAYLAYRGWPSNLLQVRMPSLLDVGWVIGGFFLLYGALFGILMLFFVIGIQPAEHDIADSGIENPEIFLLLIPFHFLIVGPAEELMFRGIIQGKFREYLGPIASITFASVIFAAFHFTAYLSPNPGEIIAALSVMLLLSILLGIIYELTDNLVVPALIHGAYNAVQMALLYAQESGLLGEEAMSAVLTALTSVIVAIPV